MSEIEEKILDWFVSSADKGISSEAMAAAFLGKAPNAMWAMSGNHPRDPADFNRCLLLLHHVPEARKHMKKVAALSDVWSKLVDRWEEVESCFLDEAGLGWSKDRAAPKTYDMMYSIIHATP